MQTANVRLQFRRNLQGHYGSREQFSLGLPVQSLRPSREDIRIMWFPI